MQECVYHILLCPHDSYKRTKKKEKTYSHQNEVRHKNIVLKLRIKRMSEGEVVMPLKLKLYVDVK
jgi:hypothetical protein